MDREKSYDDLIHDDDREDDDYDQHNLAFIQIRPIFTSLLNSLTVPPPSVKPAASDSAGLLLLSLLSIELTDLFSFFVRKCQMECRFCCSFCCCYCFYSCCGSFRYSARDQSNRPVQDLTRSSCQTHHLSLYRRCRRERR